MKAILTRGLIGALIVVTIATVKLSAATGGFFCNYGMCTIIWYSSDDDCDPVWTNLGNGQCDIDFDGCEGVTIYPDCPGMSVVSAGLLVSVRQLFLQ